MLNLADLQKAQKGKVNVANAVVALDAVAAYPKFGLDINRRAVQYFAQLMHESGEFRYDREIWGPTAAQARYDTRTDLGNTAARDGDGKLYMGRTPIQITGKANYLEYYNWCLANIGGTVPNFVSNPEAVLTAPWEGLGPVWYWSTRKLNDYADVGNVEMITRRINGGLNGYDDRLDYLVRLSLVVLGYGPIDVRAFQKNNKLTADGIAGPMTRAALHKALG